MYKPSSDKFKVFHSYLKKLFDLMIQSLILSKTVFVNYLTTQLCIFWNYHYPPWYFPRKNENSKYNLSTGNNDLLSPIETLKKWYLIFQAIQFSTRPLHKTCHYSTVTLIIYFFWSKRVYIRLQKGCGRSQYSTERNKLVWY